MNKLIVLSVLCLLLASCTNEIGRVDLNKNNTVRINVAGEKDRQIDFYLDCDIEYSEQPVMAIDFEFFKGENRILKGGLDPLLATARDNEIKSEQNGITHWKFYGKLEGNFIPTADTIFGIQPTFIKNNHPNLKINKFELVLVR